MVWIILGSAVLQLLDSYIMTSRDLDLNTAACRLLQDVMPGLETSVVFQEKVDLLRPTFSVDADCNLLISKPGSTGPGWCLMGPERQSNLQGLFCRRVSWRSCSAGPVKPSGRSASSPRACWPEP